MYRLYPSIPETFCSMRFITTRLQTVSTAWNNNDINVNICSIRCIYNSILYVYNCLAINLQLISGHSLFFYQ